MKRILLTGAAMAACGLIASVSAHAQDAEHQLDRADSRLSAPDREPKSRGAILAFDGSKKTDLPFELDISLPVSYSTNVAYSPSHQSAFHANPTVELIWKKAFDDVSLETILHIDSDLYGKYTENNASTLSGRFTIVKAFAASKSSVYARFTPTAIFDSDFGNRQVSVNAFVIGYKKAYPISEKSKFSLDTQLVHREASISKLSQDRIVLAGTYAYAYTPSDQLSVNVALQYRRFINDVFSGRKDLNGSIRLIYDHTFPSGLDLNIVLVGERNTSNLSGKGYSVWDVGPEIDLVHKF